MDKLELEIQQTRPKDIVPGRHMLALAGQLAAAAEPMEKPFQPARRLAILTTAAAALLVTAVCLHYHGQVPGAVREDASLLQELIPVGCPVALPKLKAERQQPLTAEEVQGVIRLRRARENEAGTW